MSDIPPPPVSGGGNTKYAIIGALLLLVGGGGIYLMTRKPDTPPAPRRETAAPLVDAGHTITPSLVPQIELPPEEPDAGPPVDAGRRIRYVYRTIGECNGTIDAGRVAATARAHFGGLRACYEHELRANNSLRGGMTALIKINTSGRADDVGFDRVSIPMNATFRNCVKRTLRGLAYPAPRGGCAIVAVPFNFSPRE